MTDYSPRRRGRPPRGEPPAVGPVVLSPPPATAEMRDGSVTPADPPGTPHFGVPPDAEPAKLTDVIPAINTEPLPGVIEPGSRPLDPDAPPPRRRRTSVGGFHQKLTAPSRDGYTRRWFNDDGNRLAEAEQLGYEHVQDTRLQTSSPGSRVSRLVGKKANGEPLHAFLMETPDELYAEGIAEKEAVARTVDEAITRGKATSDGQMSQIPESETYGHGEVRPDR